MPKTTERIKVSPLSVMIYIACSFLIVAYIIATRLRIPIITSTITPIESVTPQKINNYGGAPDSVETGLHINSFSEFDIVNNRFTFTGILWFYLYPQTASLEDLRNITLERGEFTHISEPAIQLIGKRMFVKYDVTGEITTPLNYQYFPIDTHRIYFILLHRGLTPQEAILDTSMRNFIFKPQLIDFGWRIFNKSGHTGIREAQLDEYDATRTREYPAGIFSIDIRRSSTRYMSTILLPLLFLVYLTTFTFAVGFSSTMRISVGAITAILAYRFVIENMSPKAGYFMLSDYFFIAALLATFIVFLANIADEHIHALVLREKHMVLLSIHGIIIVMAAFTLFL